MLSERARVRLKQGKDAAVRRRHPWIFAGAIEEANGDPGDIVEVVDDAGVRLGAGVLSPSSQIRVRMLTFGAERVSDELIRARVSSAWAMRDAMVLSADTDCARLIFGEGDLLPGLIVDVYGTVAVAQCQSASAERVWPIVQDALVQSGRVTSIVLRNDAEVRKLEGLPVATSLAWGEPITEPVRAREHGAVFTVDVMRGHKTGFYLDQRDSRALVQRHSASARVLNAFCYTGGFSVMALRGGASQVTSIDTSQAALELGQRNALDNDFADDTHDWLRGDCFDVLRGLYDDGERYDIVILDPPKFASSAKHLDQAKRGYRDLMVRGLKLVKEGGLVFAFSCSGAVSRELFRVLLSQAALHTGRSVQLFGELGHSRCHPVLTSFPEGEYLKGLWGRVL